MITKKGGSFPIKKGRGFLTNEGSSFLTKKGYGLLIRTMSGGVSSCIIVVLRYFIKTFFPPTTFTPRCTFCRRWPARFHISLSLFGHIRVLTPFGSLPAYSCHPLASSGIPRWESITEDRIRANLSKTKNIPPKTLIFSDFYCTFAMSLMILLVLICSTKVSEKSDIAKS